MITYAETAHKLAELVAAGVAEVTVSINEGVFTFPIDEVVEAFDALAPGEPFEIVTGEELTPDTIARMSTEILEELAEHTDGEIADAADAELDLRESLAPHDEHDEHVGLDLPTYAA